MLGKSANTQQFDFNLNQPLRPDLKKVHAYLERVDSNGWFTNFGPLEQELTERLQDYLGVQNLLLVANGTLALQVASRALSSSSVLSTPFSFVATASAMLWQGNAVCFADIDRKSLNLCPTKATAALQQDHTIDTVLATHVYGNPCDVEAFEASARQRGVKLIYDAAHAFGVNLGKNSVLNCGDASVLSFHATKLFHTVEGGAIAFRNSETLEIARGLINFGISSTRINGIGINAKLSEYHAAVGLVLLDEMDKVIRHRQELLALYQSYLRGAVAFPTWHQNSESNGAYMPLLLAPGLDAAQVVVDLAKHGVQSRRYFYPSLDKVFSNADFPACHVSREVSESVICLPMHYYLSTSDVKTICDALLRVIDK